MIQAEPRFTLTVAALLAAILGFAVPTEAQNLTLRGKQCRVKTDLRAKIAKPIVKRIDRYCDHFAAFYDGLGLKPRNNNRAVVRIFASYDEFADFTTRTTRLASTPAAYFSSTLNGIVSYYDDTNPYTRQVLFHETSHQYMNRYTSGAPSWVNEGLAEYFEGWQLTPEGELVKKKPAFYDLVVVQEALEKKESLPLEEMIGIQFNDFRKDYPQYHNYLHYSTAWSLVYYFLEGPNEEDRNRFIAYLKDLNERNENADPIEFDDWDALEERWKEYVQALEVKPESSDDHQILAANYRQEKEWKKAIASYERLLDHRARRSSARAIGWAIATSARGLTTRRGRSCARPTKRTRWTRGRPTCSPASRRAWTRRTPRRSTCRSPSSTRNKPRRAWTTRTPSTCPSWPDSSTCRETGRAP